MRFQPIKQINAILQQEYFEPTLSWALRVVFALNVPLLLLPLEIGNRHEIIWTAFTAYLLSLLDFRGPHYQKIFIQCIQSVSIILAAIIGMNVANNLWLSLLCMFCIGMFSALIRNWSDYGAAIGVATGFFYLFGLANAVGWQQSLHFGCWMFYGAVWALCITLCSFLFQTSNPLKRSVANIWKQNTELLDAIVSENVAATSNVSLVLEKELAVRTAINKSIELFKRKDKVAQDIQATHYRLMIELRQVSSLFAASISSLYEAMKLLDSDAFEAVKMSTIYKTFSAFSQASARIAIVVFTNRKEDLKMAKLRVVRCELAIKIVEETCTHLPLSEKEKQNFTHFLETLKVAKENLQQAILCIEEKINSKKSVQLEEYKLSFNNFLSGLNPYGWLHSFRTLFNINSQQFKYALRVSIALCIGVFIFKYFNVNHGYWIPLTIIIVIQPYYGATLKKGIARVVGTIAGIIIGGLLTLFNFPNEVYIFILIAVSFLIVYFIRHNYKVGVFFLTLMMVMLLHLSAMATWQLIIWRLISTLIGAVLAVSAGYIFWPMWEKQRFPSLMKVALEQNKIYLNVVIANLLNDSSEKDLWIRKRNLAEASNSNVFACVQRMQEEPHHIKQNVDQCFSIVGYNIRLTREITSIAFYLSTTTEKNSIIDGLQNYQTQVDKIFDVLESIVSEKNEVDEHLILDFKTLNTIVLQLKLDISAQRFIKSTLEKIVFELESMYLLLNRK